MNKIKYLLVIFGILLISSGSPSSKELDLTPKMSNPIKKTQYTVDFSNELRIPIKVYYTIKSSELKGYGRFGFHNNTPNVKSASRYDYTRSGFDRGHMFPAASATSYQSAWESFDMINILPQTPNLNRKTWEIIEEFERNNSSPYIYVICGIIRGSNEEWLYDILIPYKFFKAIYNPSKSSMIGFIVTQEDKDTNIRKFAVTIDKIEELLGEDLFYQLSKVQQKRLESSIEFGKWKFY